MGPVLGSVSQPANYEAQRGHRPGRAGAISPVGRTSSNGSAGRRSWKCRMGGWCRQTRHRARAVPDCRPGTQPVRAAGVPPPCEPGTSAGARSSIPRLLCGPGQGPKQRAFDRGAPAAMHTVSAGPDSGRHPARHAGFTRRSARRSARRRAAATSSRSVRLNAAMTDRDDTQAWLLRHSDRLLLTLIALALGVAGATGQATDIAIGSVNATSTPAGVAVDSCRSRSTRTIARPATQTQRRHRAALVAVEQVQARQPGPVLQSVSRAAGSRTPKSRGLGRVGTSRGRTRAGLRG